VFLGALSATGVADNGASRLRDRSYRFDATRWRSGGGLTEGATTAMTTPVGIVVSLDGGGLAVGRPGAWRTLPGDTGVLATAMTGTLEDRWCLSPLHVLEHWVEQERVSSVPTGDASALGRFGSTVFVASTGGHRGDPRCAGPAGGRGSSMPNSIGSTARPLVLPTPQALAP